MSNNYSLQLRHCNENMTFSTREEVLLYINGQLQYGGVKLLPYEPILFFYGADDAKNAIIMVGLPEGKKQDEKTYFLVDTANLQEQINESGSEIDGLLEKIKEEITNRENEDKRLQEQINDEVEARENAVKDLEQSISDEAKIREEGDAELEGLANFNAADIKSVIDACGLLYNEKLAEDRVSYEPDSHDEVIRDAKSISEAIDKVSKFASALGQSLKFSVDDTDTVDLTIEEDPKNGGSILKGEVKIAGADGLSIRNFDNNIIGKTNDGLYAAASIEPSTTNPNILIFKTSGYVDGIFKVDAYETEVPLTAYKGDNGKNTGVTVDVDADKNLISATLNLASDDTNLLKLEDGEYMVEGLAKNIKYKDTTVAQALTSHTSRLDDIEDAIESVKAVDIKGSETSTSAVSIEKSAKGDFTVVNSVKLSTDNSIIVANGGLSANVKASYSSGTSTLLIEVGNNSYRIDLSELAVSVLKSASYDSVTEEIVLTFIVGESEKTIRIPVGTLIHDIAVDDTDTIDLTLTSVSGGPNRISAELKVDKTHSDNILTVTSSGAYVSKAFITDAVKEESDARKSSDDEIKVSLNNVLELANTNKEDIATEVNRATKAEEKNATAIAQEIKDARAAEKNNADKIAVNTDAIGKNTNDIEAEVARAKAAENDNANAIIAETSRATLAEEKNAKNIAAEIDRAKEKEADLLDKIGDNTNNIAENKKEIENESVIARTAEKTNADAIAAEVKRAIEAETTNATAISNEVLRAIAAEEKNVASISEEVKRATKAEETLTAGIAANAENIANVTSVANTNKADIANEITRAKAAEKANADAATTNTEAIAVLTTKVNDIDKSVVEEIIRAKKSEEANATAILTEKDRANAAEQANAVSIAEEIVRAKKAEETNATAITENKTSINTLDRTLQNEITRATEVEAGINEKITKNTSDIAAIYTSVGNIELKKEGDLAYALYVNGTKHGEFIIPQDQFLKSVNYDTTKKSIIFVFNTSSGEQTQEVSVADLVDTYTNGEGVLLNGNTFSVDFAKVAAVTVVNAEIDRAKGKEIELATTIDSVKANVEEVTNRIATNETNIASLTEKLTAEVNRANEAEKKNVEAIDAEAKRAKDVETELQDSIKANRDAIVANSSAILTETTRAKEAEEQIKALNSETSGKIDAAITEVKGLITNETTRATAAEKKNSDAVVNENARALAAEKVVSDNLTQEILRAKESENNITVTVSTKADAASVYTKEEIVKLIEPYAKTADVQEKLNTKLNTTDAQNVYATKESLQTIKDTYATTDSLNSINTGLTSRIDTNEASIDNFGLTYNAATSELVYTNKNGVSTTYNLYSGSLVKGGTFDTKTNSIVLTIETAGVESKITIPVSDLLSDITARIGNTETAIIAINESIAKLAKDWNVSSSSTVELTKVTVGEKDSLTAQVKIASSNKQAIQASTSGLYVSNDLEDYTVVYGETGTISAQKAISTLLDSTKSIKNDVATNISNISSLSKDMETVKSDISILKTDVATNQSSITSLTSRVKVVEDTVNSYNTRISGVEASITNLNTTINTLIDTVASIQQTIKEITGDVGDLKTLTKDVSNLKTVTGSENYSSSKTMSERIDALEAEDVTINAEIENVEKNLIGSEENPVEGSVWAELNSIVDAGMFN